MAAWNSDEWTFDALEAQYKTPAQVTLWWLLQNQIVSIPKFVHTERIHENFDIAGFVLSQKDMKKFRRWIWDTV